MGVAVRAGGSAGVSWRDEEFSRYCAMRGQSLRSRAYALCGDWHHAEDLAQTTLLTLYRVWPRITTETRDAYAKKVLLNHYLKNHAPRRSRVELLVGAPDEFPAVATTSGRPGEDRALVLAALAGIAPRQREVLVLRYLEDRSVEETAALLGISGGTVKSQSARGLASLRREFRSSWPGAAGNRVLR